MKTHHKYGLLTAFGWNAFLLIAMLIRAQMKQVSISYFFDDGTEGIAMSIFLILWSLIWFGIGSHTRKDFLSQKKIYEEIYPDISKSILTTEFKKYYFSRHAKTLGIVFTTAIPWYVIGYVRESFSHTDFAIIASLMVLSIFCFWYYKKYKLT